MKSLIALFLLGTAIVSSCTAVVVQEPVTVEVHGEYKPVVDYNPPKRCYWKETPVYGYADVYRDGNTHVRLKQTSYVNRQWRCQ